MASFIRCCKNADIQQFQVQFTGTAKPFFNDISKIVPESSIGIPFVFQVVFKFGYNLFLQRFPNFFKNFVVLKGLSGDIQWKVAGINNTLHKAEMLGENCGIFCDENPFYEKLYRIFAGRVVDIIRFRFWNEKQCTIFH